jgi:hypothetical protein
MTFPRRGPGRRGFVWAGLASARPRPQLRPELTALMQTAQATSSTAAGRGVLRFRVIREPFG